MLNENIRAIRRSKGLSQEELAGRLHVVRQTISKWEQGTSVPDSDLLIALSEALDTPVSTLLGETVQERAPDRLTPLSQLLGGAACFTTMYLTVYRPLGRRSLLEK